jgi:short-subunit dehydrogenase
VTSPSGPGPVAVPTVVIPTVVLLGGRSEIGLAVAERLVRAAPRTVVLAARRAAELDRERERLLAAGAAGVEVVEFDAADLDGHAGVIAAVFDGRAVAEVLVCFGILGDQARAEEDPVHALEVVHTDYVAQVGVLTRLAIVMRERRAGRIVVFSSIAGARVRRANYVYGSAKAGLDGFASGLADALAGSGVGLTLVRPGFVVGRMTAGMAPAPLSRTPDQVADAVVAGLERGREVVWVPPTLAAVATVMSFVPRALWRRMPR